MLGAHGEVGENDGEIRGLLVPMQTGSGVGEPGVAPTIDGIASKFEAAEVSMIRIVSFGCSIRELRRAGRRPS